MSKLILSTLLINIIFIYNLKASSLEDLKQIYTNLITKCVIEYPITAEDVELLKNKQIPENKNFKCLIACVYKKGGVLNDKGELSIEGVNEISRKYLADNPEQAKKSEEFTKACISVNDEFVSDGSKGCERAALIFKCSLEKLPEFGFAL